MELLQQEIYGNPLADWLTALAIALAINVTVGLIKMVVVSRLGAIASRSNNHLDDSVIEIARKTKQFLILLVTLFVGSHYLDLPETPDRVLSIVATLAAFLQIGLWAGGFLDFWLQRYQLRQMENNAGAATAVAAMKFVGRLILWALVLLLALDNMGVDVTAMVAGLGVGGIAVALAVQNILGDLFASLSIIIDKPFVIGDFVTVDEYAGNVEHVGLKTTRVRSLSGEQVIFSNSDLLSARVRNYKRMQERRIVFPFGVLYQTRPEQLEAIPDIVKGIVEKQENARFDRTHFKSFGESSLDFEVVYWMKLPDYSAFMDTQQAINLALFKAFADEGIDFAYPTRTLFIENPVQLVGSKSDAEG